MDKYKFGEFIYNRRTSLGLTQDELGRKVGVTNKAVSKWEVGETLPDIQLVPLIAASLQLTTDELFNQEIKIKEEPVKQDVAKKDGQRTLWKIISLVFIVITLVLSVKLTIDSYKGKESKVISLQTDNYSSYLNVTPCLRSTNENEKLIIEGAVECLYKHTTPIQLTLTYSIQYYYLKIDNTQSLIAYMNKTIDITLEGDTQSFELELSPKNPLSNYKEFLGFNLDYQITNVQGEIEL